VIEGTCYAFSSTNGDHFRFSDHHSLDSDIAVFSNGDDAVSADATPAAEATG
jgi:hypothetical protein